MCTKNECVAQYSSFDCKSTFCALPKFYAVGFNGKYSTFQDIWKINLPDEYAAVSICPRVSALKMVVLLELGSPMTKVTSVIPICIARV